jgi:hypothetical protein
MLICPFECKLSVSFKEKTKLKKVNFVKCLYSLRNRKLTFNILEHEKKERKYEMRDNICKSICNEGNIIIRKSYDSITKQQIP